MHDWIDGPGSGSVRKEELDVCCDIVCVFVVAGCICVRGGPMVVQNDVVV